MRLDIKIAEILTIPRTKAQNLIKNEGVLVNNKLITKDSLKISEADLIEIIKTPEPEKTSLIAEKLPIEVIFEDEHLMVINKQAGVSTHPTSINGTGTIANGIAGLVEGTGFRAGIVHRLDKETTGLLMIAKTDETAFKLSEIIAKREVERKYLALCYGVPYRKSFQINANIIKDHKNRLKMRICKTSGKEAITNVSVKSEFLEKQFSLLELKLETGRTHQIRVHLNHIGNPVLGDIFYHTKPPSFFNRFHQNPALQTLLIQTKRQMLHAFALEFKHPITGQEMKFQVNPPSDFQNLLDAISDAS